VTTALTLVPGLGGLRAAATAIFVGLVVAAAAGTVARRRGPAALVVALAAFVLAGLALRQLPSALNNRRLHYRTQSAYNVAASLAEVQKEVAVAPGFTLVPGAGVYHVGGSRGRNGADAADRGALTLGSWLVEREASWLPLFALFGAAATWTKDEGAASVAALCVTAAPFAFRRPLLRSLGPPTAAAAAIVGLSLPWREWKSAHGVVYVTNLAQGLNFHFLGTRRHAATSAFHAMWSQLANVHIWFALPYLFVLVVVAAFVLRRGRALAVFSVLAPALAFLAYVWVYAIRTDPLGLSWTLDTTVTRVITSVGLMVSALLALQISVLDEPASSTRPSETMAAAPEAVAS
jgi:hypothetical protein